MVSQSESPNKPMTELDQMVRSIFSANSNVMLAAIISLLLVILFVLLLHVYAKWFLAQAEAQARIRRRRRRRTVTVSDVLGPARFHHIQNFTIEDLPFSSSPTKGLDSAIIAAIPIFIYQETEEGEKRSRDEQEQELECVICLSSFEDGEIGKSLPKCGHCFHVECIDMWLGSHSNCPTCRAPIMCGIIESDSQLGSVNGDDSSSASSSSVVEIVIDSSPSSEVSENENGNDTNGSVNVSVSVSISETSSSLLGMDCTLKRVLSKVFQSSNANELDA